MEIEYLSTSDLLEKAAPWNPRAIGDDEMSALQRSMKFFGTVQPIIVNRRSDRIVGGHMRVRAAAAENIETLPVVFVDLDEPSEKQLNIALNKISGHWDEEKLATLLAELESAGADLELTGFTEVELEELLRGADQPTEGLTDPDAVPEPPAEPKTRRLDVIKLGDHVLVCGDSADPQQMQLLLGNRKVHLVVTDPPYNVKVEPRSNNAIAAARANGVHQKSMPRQAKKSSGLTHHQSLDLARRPGAAKPTGQMRARDRELENDFLTPEEFAQKRSFYIWGGYANLMNYPKALVDAGLYFSQGIIWDKQWPVLTRKDFMGAHEWAFYGWKEGAAHFFNPEITNAQDIWRVKKVNPTAMVHLTEKPTELAELAMTYSSRRGEAVLDLFGGSGSTLIAAERMGRKAYLMEIDAAYCDVIVQRWQEYTGKKAEGWRGNE